MIPPTWTLTNGAPHLVPNHAHMEQIATVDADERLAMLRTTARDERDRVHGWRTRSGGVLQPDGTRSRYLMSWGRL